MIAGLFFAIVLALSGVLIALSFWLAARWVAPEGRRGNQAMIKVLRWFWALALGGFTAAFYWHWSTNPLPSDEELIAHFQAHRADFEELARRHREHRYEKNTYVQRWFEAGDTPEIARRAGLWRVYLGPGIWLPNPYSNEAAKRHSDAFKQGGQPFWDLQSSSSLVLQLADKRYYHPVTLRYSALIKDIVFTPEPARIENGKFLLPESYGSTIQGGYPALESLNGHPAEFRDNGCLVRRIEPQWFIFMCRNRGGGKS